MNAATGVTSIDQLIITSPYGGFGKWAADVSRHPEDVREILERHNSGNGREDLRVRSEEALR